MRPSEAMFRRRRQQGAGERNKIAKHLVHSIIKSLLITIGANTGFGVALVGQCDHGNAANAACGEERDYESRPHALSPSGAAWLAHYP